MISSRFSRVPFWEGQLAAIVTARLRMPFSWGRNDCLSFAFDCVHGILGVDAIADWRGRWHDRASAMAGLRAYCGEASVEAAMARKAAEMGWPRVPALLARRGDLVVIDGRLAVVTGAGAGTPGPEGLVIAPPPVGAPAWSI